ncbi:MFS general substrate transporter [Desarmillaria tabescens]|uniref:MFS general substrate transporter n=1 Tax=Armillaria tabescens TaxID=1929756 RepID=A0AA39NM86_ARMTA|nr:MFS general substrate transporter [Desarmillaria tabescens]KAK0468250.1 MFS general substrate transporter [Desarmillaria tabescens]
MAYNDRNPPLEDDEDQPLLLSQRSTREVLERNLLRKVDRRMSILVLIYILNFIDRNNASAARLRGFEEDLNLHGTQFASILSVLYIGYIIMQIPSNMFLDYVGKPSLYLPICMIIWGGISVMTGFTTKHVPHFFGAVCTRFFLGFVEAAFFPGALFLISKWYKRTELSQRTALLACGSLVSNAFGSLIASAILDSMEGRLGYAAWRWLFFIEGSLTVVVAICAIFILPDFPETSFGWLTPAEQALAQRRMQEDHGSVEDEKEPISGLQLALTDGKVWWLAIALIFFNVSLSFNAYFPTLMSTLGYSTMITLLLCVPPWVFATVVAVGVSRHSDHTAERFWHLSGSFLVGILGFLLAMSTMNVGARYISLFFQAQSYAGFICFLAWASGSVARPPAKRAVALALINTVGSLGNVVGSYVWPKPWEPTYSKSFTLCILASATGLTMCWLFKQHLVALNAHEEKREVEIGSERGYRYLL